MSNDKNKYNGLPPALQIRHRLQDSGLSTEEADMLMAEYLEQEALPFVEDLVLNRESAFNKMLIEAGRDPEKMEELREDLKKILMIGKA